MDARHLVNVAEGSLLNALVLDNLTENTSVSTADDQDPLGVGVRVHGQVGDHLLVGELISLGGLDDIVQDENVAVVGGLEDEDVLVLALLVVQDLLDLKGHGLACDCSAVRKGLRDSCHCTTTIQRHHVRVPGRHRTLGFVLY